MEAYNAIHSFSEQGSKNNVGYPNKGFKIGSGDYEVNLKLDFWSR